MSRVLGGGKLTGTPDFFFADLYCPRKKTNFDETFALL
jgi:hypothetical protein